MALLDPHTDGPVRMGTPSAVAHDGNDVVERSLSGAVHDGVPEVDGILFSSRFTGDACEAVFERASAS